MRLSIIIPLFNNFNYIKNAVDSCYDSSLDIYDYEIIIVNDGSTEFSFYDLKKTFKNYKNVVLFDQPNKGVSAARNQGMKISKGNFTLFLDSDDELSPKSINSHLLFSENNNLDVLVTSHSNSVKNNVNQKSKYFYSKILSGIKFFKSGYWPTSSCGIFISSKLLKINQIKFIEGVRNGEDNIFMTLVFNYAKYISTTNHNFYFINQSASGASRNWNFQRLNDLLNTILKSEIEFGKRKLLYTISYNKLVYSFLSNSLFHFSKLKLSNNQKALFFDLYKKISIKNICGFNNIIQTVKFLIVKNYPYLVIIYYKYKNLF